VRPFEYLRAGDADEAIAAVAGDPGGAFLAGGTTQVDLMREEVLRPTRLVDIGRLPLRGVAAGEDAVRIGALTTMADAAADPLLRERLPLVAEALLAGASAQLRNMATIGGNLLQGSRCRYYRDRVFACNRREPGSGCGAIAGHHRMHAVLGTSERCIATHGSDLAVALVALDAVVQLRGPAGPRRIALSDLYLRPGDTPQAETVLAHGELITEVEVPLPPAGTRSHYLKVRDRASYEFALASAAVALAVDDQRITYARVALGGLATVPWRSTAAEQVLRGAPPGPPTFRACAEAALAGAAPRRDNAFKVELGKRTLVRALQTVAGAA
jgi:xanthine dehydrogenase YagS FAD-binding subunit